MDTYSAFLRVRHPTIDPREVTRALGLEPAHSWAAGTPRDRDGAGAGRGLHTESYWLAELGAAPPGVRAAGATEPATREAGGWRLSARLPLESFLLGQIRLLAPCRSFLARISAEGGSCVLAVTLSAPERVSIELPAALLRALADLNLAVTIDVGTDAESAAG